MVEGEAAVGGGGRLLGGGVGDEGGVGVGDGAGDLLGVGGREEEQAGCSGEAAEEGDADAEGVAGDGQLARHYVRDPLAADWRLDTDEDERVVRKGMLWLLGHMTDG